MSQEYSGGWVSHLADMLWAYRSSPKSATGFSPFSLVYGIEAVSPRELMISSLSVLHAQKKGIEKDVFLAESCKNLEGLDEKREEA